MLPCFSPLSRVAPDVISCLSHKQPNNEDLKGWEREITQTTRRDFEHLSSISMKSIPPPGVRMKEEPGSTSSALQSPGHPTRWTVFHCPPSSFCLVMWRKFLRNCHSITPILLLQPKRMRKWSAWVSWNRLLLGKKSCYFNTSVQCLKKATLPVMYELLQLKGLSLPLPTALLLRYFSIPLCYSTRTC